MKYRLQAIDDEGRVMSNIEIDALHIPRGGDLVVRVDEPMTTSQLASLHGQLRTFFGERHRVLIVQGNVSFLRLVETPE